MTIPSAALLKFEIVGPSMLFVLVVHRFICFCLVHVTIMLSKYSQIYNKDYTALTHNMWGNVFFCRDLRSLGAFFP